MPDTGADDAGRKKRARALAANRDAARFYHDYLKGPGGARVRDYLAQRQVAPRTATRFGLGAAPEQWDALTRALTAKGYSKMELIDAGLAVAGKNGGVYDKFRARLMLPVIDVDVYKRQGLSGRTLRPPGAQPVGGDLAAARSQEQARPCWNCNRSNIAIDTSEQEQIEPCLLYTSRCV